MCKKTSMPKTDATAYGGLIIRRSSDHICWVKIRTAALHELGTSTVNPGKRKDACLQYSHIAPLQLIYLGYGSVIVSPFKEISSPNTKFELVEAPKEESRFLPWLMLPKKNAGSSGG